MRIAVILLGLLAIGVAQGGTFDLGSTPATGLGTLSSTSDGVTLTITRQNGALFDTVGLGLSGPATWTGLSLAPFAHEGLNTGFVFDFSTNVDLVSFQLGDAGGDDDTYTVQAYSGSGGAGTLLSSLTGTWGARNFLFTAPQDIVVSATGIRSLVIIGGSPDFPESLYYSNISASTSVPEPSSFALIGASIVALTLWPRGSGPHPMS